MKKIFTLIITILCATVLFAQAPEKFTYQAVVRNASNSLVANQNVSVRISILQGSATGSAVYVETQTVTTNVNGLMTLSIGEGTEVSGTFSGIDWANGPYFLKSEIDPDGGVSYTIESVQQLLSVPYALYANTAGNGFSGDYNDLTNTPDIPTVPTNVSAFTNDAGYITMDSIPAIPTVPTNVSAFTNDAGYITMDSIPAIPTVPTNVSAFTNDAGYITMDSVPAIPTNVSTFVNDAGYITMDSIPVSQTVPTNVSAFTNDAGYITLDSIPEIPTVPTNVSAFTNDAGYITMDSIPEIPTVPTNVSAFTNDAGYITMDSIPAIPTVPANVSAFTNDAGYITMDSVPAIPTNVSTFVNDAGYITMDSIPASQTVPTNVSAFTNDAGYITMDSIPEIPTVPTNVSAFTNDAGYITMDSIPTIPTNVSAFTNDAGYLTSANVQEAANIPTNVSAFTNDAGYITMDSIPTIPTVPTNVSAFTNDAGYITMDSIPTIPTVPSNVSAFTNDAGYITMDSIPMIPTLPTNVSAFTNDAGYITMDSIPAIPAAANDATLTIQKNGESVGTFTANAIDNQTINITVPTTTSQLDNNSGYITLADVQQLIDALNNRIDSLENEINVINGGTWPSTPEDTVDGGPCPGQHTVTDVEGNTYNTVWIGEQCWMKENLRTRRYADNTPISLGTTASTTDAYRYYPNNDSANVATYGYLYNWVALMHGAGASNAIPSNVQGVCPDGWHLPSQGEWNQLTNYVRSKSEFLCDGSNANWAKALASTTGWDSHGTNCTVGNNPSDNNQTGFSAMPAGYFFNNACTGLGMYAYWWSTGQNDATEAWAYYMSNASKNTNILGNLKNRGNAVRCLKGAAGSVVVSPTVSTSAVSGVTQTTAICGGDVTNDGGSPVTARGVCYGTSNNVTLDNSTHTVEGSGTGPFTSNLTGLTPGTAYRVRAYATNSEGTSYGSIRTFTTTYDTDGQPCPGAATVTDVDGNVYNTTMVGDVCWMKENLRTTKFSDGTPIALGSDTSSTVAYRYYPGNDSANVATYGYLYNWSAFIHNQEGQTGDLQGICPTGWHIPKSETQTLSIYVSGQADYICGGVSSNNAKALASTAGWDSSSIACSPGNDPTSNNITGFSLPPAGYYLFGLSYNLGQTAVLWHATYTGTLNRWPYRLSYNYTNFVGGGGQSEVIMKTYGYSVRCVRN